MIWRAFPRLISSDSVTPEWFAAYLFNVITISLFIDLSSFHLISDKFSLFFLPSFSFAHEVVLQSDFDCNHWREKKWPLKSHNLFTLKANGVAFIYIPFDHAEVLLTVRSPIPSRFPYFYLFNFILLLTDLFCLLPPMNHSSFPRHWCFLCTRLYCHFWWWG